MVEDIAPNKQGAVARADFNIAEITQNLHQTMHDKLLTLSDMEQLVQATAGEMRQNVALREGAAFADAVDAKAEKLAFSRGKEEAETTVIPAGSDRQHLSSSQAASLSSGPALS